MNNGNHNMLLRIWTCLLHKGCLSSGFPCSLDHVNVVIFTDDDNRSWKSSYSLGIHSVCFGYINCNRAFIWMIMRSKRNDIVWYVTFSSLKGLITAQSAIDVFWIWTIIAPGSIIVLDSITESFSFYCYSILCWLSLRLLLVWSQMLSILFKNFG